MILAAKVDFWRSLSYKVSPKSKLALFLYLFWAILGATPIWIASLIMVFGNAESDSWLPIPVQGLLFAVMGGGLIYSTWMIAGYHRWPWLLAPLGMTLFFLPIEMWLAVVTGLLSFVFVVISLAIGGQSTAPSDDDQIPS